MIIRCSVCGLPVSTDVPDNTIIAAWVECDDCIKRNKEDNKKIINIGKYAIPALAKSGVLQNKQ